ncbi:MAG: hypothetical protein AAF614_37575 [Chloroflexota bacterium]
MFDWIKDSHWVSDSLLALLISVLSIFAAYAAFLSAQIDSASTDAYFHSQSLLLDANATLLLAAFDENRDRRLMENATTLGQNEPELADAFVVWMTPEGAESFRLSGDIDDQYVEEIYGPNQEIYLEYLAEFERGTHDGDRADAYQLTVLIVAIGLSFAAWAALTDEGNRLRAFYFMLSVGTFVIAIAQMLMIPTALSG